jgi:dUTP pyrophosphatase
MPKYIDRDKLLKLLEDEERYGYLCAEDVYSIPVADDQKVQRGANMKLEDDDMKCCCELCNKFAETRTTKLSVQLDAGAYMPEKAHEHDAGYDLRSCADAVIMPGEAVCFDTGVHIELPEGTAGFLKSKSGLNVKYGITSEGVIDCGYTGPIIAKLYNHGHEPYYVKKGDKITQLVILKLADVSALEPADKLGETERGNNGFGSTGR